MSAAESIEGAAPAPSVPAEPAPVAEMTDREILEATLLNSRATLALVQAQSVAVAEFGEMAKGLLGGGGGMAGLLAKALGTGKG